MEISKISNSLKLALTSGLYIGAILVAYYALLKVLGYNILPQKTIPMFAEIIEYIIFSMGLYISLKTYCLLSKSWPSFWNKVIMSVLISAATSIIVSLYMVVAAKITDPQISQEILQNVDNVVKNLNYSSVETDQIKQLAPMMIVPGIVISNLIAFIFLGFVLGIFTSHLLKKHK